MSITVEHLPKGVALVTLSIETSRNGFGRIDKITVRYYRQFT